MYKLVYNVYMSWYLQTWAPSCSELVPNIAKSSCEQSYTLLKQGVEDLQTQLYLGTGTLASLEVKTNYSNQIIVNLIKPL